VIALLDRVALFEENLFKVTLHSGLDLNATNGVDAADKIARFRNLLPHGKDGSDWRRFFLSISGKNA
jgi:hypothetical protein